MPFRLKLAPDESAYDFMALARIGLLASAAMVVAALLATVAIGLNFGIDFKGGTLVEARFEAPVDLSAVRSTLTALDLGDVTVQEFGRPDTVQMRIEGQDDGAAQQAAAEIASTALREAFAGVDIRRTEVVGPKVSGELIERGVIAVVAAIVLVLGYIWLRFEWQFAIGAVVALMHDVVLTIGVFSILQLEFTLAIIAAILTIVGYSLNDTVVVFDRVRENARRYKSAALGEVLNRSLNETLSRTVMTSVTTLLALMALYFFGGPALAGFTFAMIWGVVVGTYSSIFVASPILELLGVKPGGPAPEQSAAGVQFGG